MREKKSDRTVCSVFPMLFMVLLICARFFRESFYANPPNRFSVKERRTSEHVVDIRNEWVFSSAWPNRADDKEIGKLWGRVTITAVVPGFCRSRARLTSSSVEVVWTVEVHGSTADRGGESWRDRPLSLRPVAVRVVDPFGAFRSDLLPIGHRRIVCVRACLRSIAPVRHPETVLERMKCYGRSGDGASVIKRHERVETRGGILACPWPSVKTRVIRSFVPETLPLRNPLVKTRCSDRCSKMRIVITVAWIRTSRWQLNPLLSKGELSCWHPLTCGRDM